MDEGQAQPAARRLQELVGSVSSVVAPITLISAVLFYFGYVYTTTEYAYFGLDVDTIGLSTQEFIMRSPTALLTPLLAAALVTAAVALAHGWIRRRIDGAADAPWRLRPFRRFALGCGVAGRLALVAGSVMVATYTSLRPLLVYYDFLTPMVLAVGAGLTVYGVRLDGLLGRPRRRVATLALYTVLTASLLLATATLAQYIGAGDARKLVAQLQDRPGVILDTKERLYLTTTTTVVETVLKAGTDQTFHYRYRNLRLLIQGKDRLFLVPSPWSRGDTTLMVPMDDEVRVQFVR